MKNFIVSFLGSLAALWVTVALVFVSSIIFMVVALAGAASGKKAVEVRDKSVLVLDLAGEVTDRPVPSDFMTELTGQPTVKNLPLNQVTAAIREAAGDDHIKCLLIKAGGVSAGLAQVQAIVDAVADFKTSGKTVMAYGDSYTQGDYIIASGADSLMVNPVGMIDIHGLESTTLYFKELLAKIGVEVQVVKVGTYKSAVEPFLLDSMSAANREQQTVYLSAIWNDLRRTIADGRGLSSDSAVNTWADAYAMTQPAEWYVENSLVDGLRYRHQIDETLRDISGLKEDDDVREITVTDYFTARGLDKPGRKGDKKMIAVLYAVGDITENGKGGIASERLVPQIFDLIDNDDIDGLILRVNSGGGSAYASEQIWEALEQFKKRTGKPFFVSMGDVAASGGYYISCGADKIFAEPVTLTGSIGIFGMIPSAQKLLNDKLGVNTGTVMTNTPSLTIFKPMPPAQRSAMQAYVDRGYDLFTRRCAEGRHISQDSIKAIGEGRVWAGANALEIGLVDNLGSLDDCIEAMAEHLDAPGNYIVREYPKIKFTFMEQLMSEASNLKASWVESELGAAAPCYRAIRSLENLDPLQARMDYVEIN